jgi:hypothetical protein
MIELVQKELLIAVCATSCFFSLLYVGLAVDLYRKMGWGEYKTMGADTRVRGMLISSFVAHFPSPNFKHSLLSSVQSILGSHYRRLFRFYNVHAVLCCPRFQPEIIRVYYSVLHHAHGSPHSRLCYPGH